MSNQTAYHLTPSGQARVCKAMIKCRYTSSDGVIPEHYTSIQEAHKAYEEKMSDRELSQGLTKNKNLDKKLKESIKAFIEEEYDENGNTVYRGPKHISNVVRYNETDYTLIDFDKGIYAYGAYSLRFQVGRELSVDDAEQLAQLVGYEYAKTGGERGNNFEQDSPNSIIYYADTTKGDGERVDNFAENVKNTIKEGTPIRKTDRSGEGTKGTRLVEGLESLDYIVLYTDYAN